MGYFIECLPVLEEDKRYLKILVLSPPFTVSFLLDIIGNIRDSKNNSDMAEVSLKIPTEDREYFIFGGGKKITVNSSTPSVELPKCQIYTVEVKNGRCSAGTASSFPVPKGRCKRVLVVCLFVLFSGVF